MAKKNLDEPCIFCGDTPCSCEGVAKKAAKPKKATARKTKPAAPIVTPSTTASDLPMDSPKPNRFKAAGKVAERDLSEENTLRVLRDIVSDADKRHIDKMLARHYPQDVDRRIAEWKENHVRSEQESA